MLCHCSRCRATRQQRTLSDAIGIGWMVTVVCCSALVGGVACRLHARCCMGCNARGRRLAVCLWRRHLCFHDTTHLRGCCSARRRS